MISDADAVYLVPLRLMGCAPPRRPPRGRAAHPIALASRQARMARAVLVPGVSQQVKDCYRDGQE